jgi:hypothetical protein
MSEPWEIPPIPKRGDRSERVTHAAVGLAMSRWEGLEVSFAHLYSVFETRSRFDTDANRKYGIPLNFRERLAGLERSGGRFFAKHPNQDDEGRFSLVANDARRFSERRNDIAHGIARPIHWVLEPGKSSILSAPYPMQWCIVPPHFKGTKFTRRHLPTYVYTSREIKGFCEFFYEMGMAANRLAHDLERRYAPPTWLQTPRVLVSLLSKALAQRGP